MTSADISVLGLLMFVVVGLVQALHTGFLTKGYLPKKGELRALSEEQSSLRDQLAQNTAIVETIRDDLAQKTWAKQQLWETKKEAYDQVWANMLNMKEFVTERLSIDENYYDIFLNHCGFTGGAFDDHTPDDIINDYYEHADAEIARQKDWFNETYNTEQYIKEQDAKKNTYILNMTKCIKNIELQSLYLSPEASRVANFLKDLLAKHFKDNSYTWYIFEHEGLTESEWYEHIISEYKKLLNSIDAEMEQLRVLVEKELYISTH
ncbi:hypothetical protein [Vibrio vulnificus]|uniref:hypothetical protein n=2 Tax=Vibrio vulnificus TaxID=672 RepID=UPI0019D46398|nr:hypothetical protein [Vibrio vulnificus]HAS3381365.1 hypothetical protein [Vibrio cholerae]MBN8133739.1 hypothetical protein [Vibrio vulnificus]MBN8138384.1 hypothetical protein [Vibrio vulnificus]MBN8161443.1 hypothetical protein [Vibrio vulnificus]HAS3410311.1 hypothetical protein [Vibrio cholerae]